MSQPDDVPVGDVARRDASGNERRRPGGPALLGIAAIIAIGLAAALIAWLLIDRSDDETSTATPPAQPAGVPEIASLDDLRALADSGETFYCA